MKRHAIPLTSAALGAIWLAANGVMLFYAASLVPLAALLIAFGALSGAFGLALAILIASNTRRPAGIDPNAPPVSVDPFAMSSEDLKNAVLLADNMPYGRRKHDDSAVVKRLIGKFEDEDRQRPPPATTPAWALELQEQHEDAAKLFPDTPKEEL